MVKLRSKKSGTNTSRLRTATRSYPQVVVQKKMVCILDMLIHYSQFTQLSIVVRLFSS